MTAKEYLRQYQIASREIERIRGKREAIRADMYSLSSPSGQTDYRVQTSADGDKMLDIIARVDAIERDLAERQARLALIRATIAKQISELPNSTYQDILERRYIHGDRWEKIISDTGYADRHVYRLHGEALEAFRRRYLEQDVS